MEKLLKPEEVAKCLGIELSTVYNWTHSKKIPHHKIGGLVRFRESEIEAWINKPKEPKKTTEGLRVKTSSTGKRKNPYIDSIVEKAKAEVLR